MRAQRAATESAPSSRAGDVWFAVHHDWFQTIATAAGSPACHVAIDVGHGIAELRGGGLQTLDHETWAATHTHHYRLDSGMCPDCRRLVVELADDLHERGMSYSYPALYWSAVEGLLPAPLDRVARRRAFRNVTTWASGTCSTFVGDLLARASAGCGCLPVEQRALSPGDLERALRRTESNDRPHHPRREHRRAARMVE